MKVYLFSDLLKSINGDELDESKAVAEIEPIKKMPDGLVKINGKHAKVCCININTSSDCYIEWVDEPAGDSECDFENEAKCPHCGYENRDSWKFSDEDEHECETCGTSYSIVRNIEVTYSTKVIDRNCEVLSISTLSKA